MKKVIIGMSGGVDSAVSAYLLKQQGYEVVGLFMRNWDSLINNDILGNEDISQDICPQEKDYLDAKQVADLLDIKLERVDFIKEYWDYVFKNFIDEYSKGRTPNPDILCNKFIKFDLMLNYALDKLGGDYLATGHYAKIIDGQLHKSDDKTKDQSYFLSQLSRQQLEKVIFPLASYTKKEVRKIAKEINLNIADKKDSTGICFIGERNFAKFLENYIPSKPGKIIDITSGNIIGNHNGVMYYTFGQRKGLNLGGMDQRYFLAAKNIINQELYVAPASKEKEYLGSNKLEGIDLNLNTNNFDIKNLKAKFRYRQPDIKIYDVEIVEKKVFLKYDTEIAITPGQQVVLYENDKCIGGAIINRVFMNDKEINLFDFSLNKKVNLK